VPRSLQAWAGELVGTFMFITVICASVIIATSGLAPGFGLVGIGLAHFVALASVITAFAAISGGHFNPAVTLSAWIGRKIGSADALGYIACQILGALGAGVTLRVMFTEAAWRASNLGTPTLSVSTGKGVLIEAVLTFILVMVIWGTGIDERGPRVGGFAIGGVLGAMVLAFGPLTGVGLNPARFLGPAAVAGHVNDWWVYFLGPIIGGAVAGVLYPTIFMGGFPWARIGGSPDRAPDTVSAVPASVVEEEFEEDAVPVRRPATTTGGARSATPSGSRKRKPAARKRRAE
jgi:MIP family channel proteins